nr:pentachlorophenol monooxygenase [Actinomycetota bacterium]
QRPWPGRPPWGAPPAPVPGVVLPDGPVRTADAGAERIRQLVRRRVTVLVADPQDAPAAATALDRALPAGVPRQVLALPEIDPTGAVGDSLQVAGDDLWLIRPDAYTAARVTSPDELARAARRAIGSPT